MSYNAINNGTDRAYQRHRERAKLRRWRPTLADLFLRGQAAGRQPTSTKRGPGRRHKQGHPKLQRRRIEAARREMEGS